MVSVQNVLGRESTSEPKASNSGVPSMASYSALAGDWILCFACYVLGSSGIARKIDEGTA
jgi:hypothetical protein